MHALAIIFCVVTCLRNHVALTFVHKLAFFCVTCHVSRLKNRNPREVASHLASTFSLRICLIFRMVSTWQVGTHGSCVRNTYAFSPLIFSGIYRLTHNFVSVTRDMSQRFWKEYGVGACTYIFGCIVYYIL